MTRKDLNNLHLLENNEQFDRMTASYLALATMAVLVPVVIFKSTFMYKQSVTRMHSISSAVVGIAHDPWC